MQLLQYPYPSLPQLVDVSMSSSDDKLEGNMLQCRVKMVQLLELSWQQHTAAIPPTAAMAHQQMAMVG